MKFDGIRGPNGPMAQESADHPVNDGRAVAHDLVGREQVVHDVVVVASVESNIVAAAFGNGADYREGAIAVEGGDLDCASVLDLAEAAPKFDRQVDAADGGLKVKAEEADDIRHETTVFEELL